MKTQLRSLVFFVALCLTCPAIASKTPLSLTPEGISFELSDQEGQISAPCTLSLLPHAGDFAVECKTGSAPEDLWKFTVHAKLFVHKRERAPKLSYEFLYWVTNQRAQPGGKGKYLGTTLWFNFEDQAVLSSLEAGQDIEDTWVLKMKVQLKN